MAEGKTLVPTVLCSLCDEDKSVKFCTNCQQELCLRCSRIHSKIQATSHHNVINLVDRGNSGAGAKTTSAYCKEHTSKQLSIICNECLCALCEICADRDHKSHKILRTNLNAELLHRVCVQKAPEFLDLLQKLQKEKDGSPQKLQLYNSARDMVKSWKVRLRQIIEDDSAKLLDQIEKEIKNQERLLADISTNIKDAVQRTDQQMNIMSSARKIDDPTTLLSTIHEGDAIIKNAKLLLGEIESTRKAYTIDDLLPNSNELQNVETALHKFFTAMTITETKHKRRSYNLMKEINKQHLGTGRFIVSNARQNKSKIVVLHRESTDEICTFDTANKTRQTFTCGKNIYRMATLSNHKHVIIVEPGYDVHILDGSFQVIHSLPHDNKYEADGVFPKSQYACILTARTRKGKCITQISEITVSNTGKATQTEIMTCEGYNWNGHLSLHTDLQYLLTFTTSEKSLCMVNIITKQYTKRDLSPHLTDGINALSVDEDDNLLIHSCDGRVHLFSQSKYEGELQNMRFPGHGGGFFFRDDDMYIVAGGYIYTNK